MKNLVLKSLAIATMAATVSGAAMADSADFNFDGISPNTLKVVGDGTQYTALKSAAGNVDFDFRMEYDTGNAGRIKRWEARVIDHGVYWSGFNWGFYDRFQGYQAGNRPKSIDIDSSVSIPKTALESTAVEVCNLSAAAMKQNGSSDFEIYGKTRTIKSDFTMAFDVEATGAGSGNVVIESAGETGIHNLTVICERKRGVVKPGLADGTGGIQSQNNIVDAKLNLVPMTSQSGTCKAKLMLQVTSSMPHTPLKFRYIHSSGAKSKVYSAQTGANKKAGINRDFDVPVDGQGWAEGMFHVESTSGAQFETLPVLYKFKCNKPIGGINSGQGTTKRFKLN